MNETSSATRPELGIMTEKIWREIRMYELIYCIARHRKDEVKKEWMLELRTLMTQNIY